MQVPSLQTLGWPAGSLPCNKGTRHFLQVALLLTLISRPICPGKRNQCSILTSEAKKNMYHPHATHCHTACE